MMTDLAQLIASLRAGAVTPADLDAAADALAGMIPQDRAWQPAPLTVATGRCKVPQGQTPLNDNLGHHLIDVFNEGSRARDTDAFSPYHGHSLEHLIHAAGWVQRDLRLALDAELSSKDAAPLTLADALAVPEVRALVDAAKPFYAAVFNDNGDVTISTGHITTADWLRLDAAMPGIGGAA